MFAIFKAADEIDAPADTRTEFRIFLRMLCYTGMRLSEPLRLTCADVNLEQGTAHLLMTKGGFPRLVHLPPVVVEELRRLPRGLDRPGRLFKFHVSGRLRELFAMTLEKAGVTLPHRVGFHVFSHTWATWMRMYGGLDTYDLLKTDRWSDPNSADRYAHVVVSDQEVGRRICCRSNQNAKPCNTRVKNADGSNGGRSLHTGEVVGSIPTAPTMKSLLFQTFYQEVRSTLDTFRYGTPTEHDATIRVKSV